MSSYSLPKKYRYLIKLLRAFRQLKHEVSFREAVAYIKSLREQEQALESFSIEPQLIDIETDLDV